MTGTTALPRSGCQQGQYPAKPSPQPARNPFTVPQQCRQLIDAGALFAISTSGGKDSQAMTILIASVVPHQQIVAFHAPLKDVEWPGTVDHIRNTLPPDIPLVLAHKAHEESLLDRVRRRGMWPGPQQRYCTSEWKTSPIRRETGRHLKRHPEFSNLVVSALGLRAEESSDRAAKHVWTPDKHLSRAGRKAWTWLPLLHFTTEQVFRVIAHASQKPHPVYRSGYSRCSCTFCIFGTRRDFTIGATLRPSLYAQYVAIERETGHTLSPSGIPLTKITGIDPDHPSPTATLPLPASPQPQHRPPSKDAGEQP